MRFEDMKIQILSRKMDKFHNLVYTYFSVKMLLGIFPLLLLPLLFSCFSPEQKTVSLPPKVEEKVPEKVKTPPVDVITKEEKTGEDTQTSEPIRVQSTITPVVDMRTQEESVTENTSETQTSATEPIASNQKEKQSEEVTSKSEEETAKIDEVPSHPDSLHKVKIGMNYNEVVKLIGDPDFLITQSADGQMKLYRWNREDKVLYGRFEKGVLKRYSGKSAENESENAPAPLTRELYDQLKEGMELDEVVAILQRTGTQVSSDNKGGNLYLWTDKEGSSFSARFEDNKLVRKSGFYIRPVPVEKSQVTDEEEEEGSLEENTVNEKEESPPEGNNNVPIPDSEQEQSPMEEGQVYQEPYRSVPQSDVKPLTPTRIENRRIIYAGNPKKFSEDNSTPTVIKQSSLKRKVKLPDYTYQIRDGSYEIKIYNPLDTSVKVGLRSGKRGKNVSIPAGGVKSIKVPRGDYQFVYIRDDEPTELQQGGNVTIDGLFVGDIEVMLLK